jgi:RHS repeat-associated protein
VFPAEPRTSTEATAERKGFTTAAAPAPGPGAAGGSSGSADATPRGADATAGSGWRPAAGAPPAPPSVSLPKGGGAIRDIGEKFAVSAATGTGSLTIPVATSAGRAGFGPSLSLSYDSGGGNGPFGLGWKISLPTVTRKTDKGLPRYVDDPDADTFILAGAEDLVPVRAQRDGTWREAPVRRTEGDRDYMVQGYRPRIEGLFARIERWRDLGTGEAHWRTITSANVTTVYGATAASRIADPEEPSRVFSWLVSVTYDDTGNAMAYDYAPEDSAQVDTALPSERNRTPRSRSANRYLKRIRYGNREPWRPSLDAIRAGAEPGGGWLFEAVFDYGDHRDEAPLPGPDRPWPVRSDPFSTYRPGFEVRTYRRCQRVLMFHHFPEEPGVGADCLVTSTDLAYASTGGSGMTSVASVTHTGYRRTDSGYRCASLPPLEMRYSEPVVGTEVRDLDPEALANLPAGIDGTDYQWTDLDGEGLSGILARQGGAWFYKRNLGDGRFAALRMLATQPIGGGPGSRQQLLDLAGDGHLDLAALGGAMPGAYQRTADGGWQSFRPFLSCPNVSWDDPNLRMVDLDGDGLADVLITGDDGFTWYPSLGLDGFGEAERTYSADPWSEERGPRLMLADPEQTIYLADMSGDGLSDLVRVRDGEVCYWPNTGFGRFAAKVTMDNSPWLDEPALFDQRRVRLGDIDGTGCADLIYLGAHGVRLYLNQSGNGYGEPLSVTRAFPLLDSLNSVMVADLLGRGTACLVWSSPLPGDAGRQVRYVDLMAEGKPYLLTEMINNLGAETRVSYASSTKFYLADQSAGRPWITRLPFPVQVVERVETIDRINRNKFTTRHAYHHGYFDGWPEREFRGFGMVEHWDTEELAVLGSSAGSDGFANLDPATDLPPVLTRTWLHTGVFPDESWVSRQYAAEYWRAPGGGDPDLPDTPLPDTLRLPGAPRRPWRLSATEAREACRALKGMPLREEVYALDGTDAESRPYLVTEHNYTIELLQPAIDPVPDGPQNYHAVLLTHARESIAANYERALYRMPDGAVRADPRITHDVVLDVDEYGNPLRSAALAYGRRYQDRELTEPDQEEQARLRLTCTHNRYTNAVDAADDYRTPLPCETRVWEVVGLRPGQSGGLFRFEDLRGGLAAIRTELPYQDWKGATGDVRAVPARRLIEHTRIRYRRDDLAGPLPLGTLEPLAIPYRSYRLAFTRDLLSTMYGDRVTDQMLTQGGYVEDDGTWWLPSGQVFFSPDAADGPPAELAFGRRHFFLPHQFRDPFGQVTRVAYDRYDLLISQTRDPLGNLVTAGEVNAAGQVISHALDYRVLQPHLVSDANRNRAAVAFDVLGRVAGNALMGKPEEQLGDSLSHFNPDPDEAAVDAYFRAPATGARQLLGSATTRVLYDLDAYRRSSALAHPRPAGVASIARETHGSDLTPGEQTKIQRSFSYSDGFGREVQQKIQAVHQWTGSGWTVFNNKGKPVRSYEPFFTRSHEFEFNARAGVSPVLFYDPVERVVATLHPNHTWEKVVFDPWRRASWDAGDTVLVPDPGLDQDAGSFFRLLSADDYLPTWYDERQGGALGAAEQNAARKAGGYADTPTIGHADPLGRTFLTVSHNKFSYSGSPADAPVEEYYRSEAILDIQGNPREITDARRRLVMRYDYNIAGGRCRQDSMDAGERLTLMDVVGKSVYAWDSRGHRFRTEYDPLHRPTDSFISEGHEQELLFGRSVYGETRPDPEGGNLRGEVFQVLDQAGIATNGAYDFKGNLIHSAREFAVTYKARLDWSLPVPLEAERYVSRACYDALNRVTQQIAPHADNDSASVNVVEFIYDESARLEQIHAWPNQQAEPTSKWLDPATADMHAVTSMEYDAKGQRTSITYGNRVRTTYEYDRLTFCLIRLRTRRPDSAFPDDCPHQERTRWPGCDAQNLQYTYDPAGNITRIRDHAQQAIFFRNRRVTPSADFTYDAVYRLIEATGREHLGQAVAASGGHSRGESPAFRSPHPADGNAMGRYLERYFYDAAGNPRDVRHVGCDTAAPGWTRAYQYDEASSLTATQWNNRLTSVETGGATDTYSVDGDGYDPHGNPLRMPHLHAVAWDFRDQLQMIQKAAGHSNPDKPRYSGERTWYVYDAAGRRARKVTESGSGEFKEERIYLGGIEIFRSTGTNPLVRETLHIMDGKQRVALVATRTQGSEPGVPERLVRYQLSNQLASVLLELDDRAHLITYEEYTPYGSTSCQIINGRAALPKLYRYVGKEHDEESGFYYFGLRYYMTGLGRWLNFDPQGLRDGPNGYEFVHCNPVNLADPDGGSWKSFAAGAVLGLGTALAVAAVIVTAPITIPTAVVVGAVAVGVGVSGYTVVQSARQRDLLNRPISKDQADFQMGGVFGGLVAGGISGALGGGTGAVGGGVFATVAGPSFAQGAVAITPAITTAVAAGVSVAPTAMAMMNSGGSGGGDEAPAPTKPAEAKPSPAAAPKQGSSTPKPSGTGHLPEGFEKEAVAQLEKGALKSEGEMLSDLTSHGNASRVRAATGAVGESAHTAPQAAMRTHPGYDPQAAITRILNRVTHRGFDNPWKAEFQKLARGTGDTTITAQKLFDTVKKAALGNPHFRPGEAKSVVQMLSDELFVQQGLKPTDLVRLPYSKAAAVTPAK